MLSHCCVTIVMQVITIDFWCALVYVSPVMHGVVKYANDFMGANNHEVTKNRIKYQLLKKKKIV